MNGQITDILNEMTVVTYIDNRWQNIIFVPTINYSNWHIRKNVLKFYKLQISSKILLNIFILLLIEIERTNLDVTD